MAAVNSAYEEVPKDANIEDMTYLLMYKSSIAVYFPVTVEAWMRPYNRTTNTTDKVLILNWDMYSDENAPAGQVASFGCIVVITSALHAEGRGFDPRPEYYYRTRVFLFRKHEPFRNSLKILNSYKKGFKTQNIEVQEKLLRSY